MFAIGLVVVLSAGACGDLCTTGAVEHYAQLNALAALTRYDSERAAFLVRRVDGRLVVVAWPAGGPADAEYRGRIPLGCVAVIHTHPSRTPQPSRRDIAEARRIGIPIVVITSQSVTVAMPTGATAQLFSAGWSRRQ